MKDVAPHDRPREKLERLGAAALGDNELLALVFGSGSRGRDALGLANTLLRLTDGLHGLTRAGVGELRDVPGVGRARAAQVLAAVELGRRTLLHDRHDRPGCRPRGSSRPGCCRSSGRRPSSSSGSSCSTRGAGSFG